MSRRRSILIHGLGIALRRFPAFLWAYAFNIVLALTFCSPLKLQLSNLLDNSLAAQRLSSGFDLGTVAAAIMRINEGGGGNASAMTSHGSVPLYLLLYFLLVPGSLYCYLTRTHARLSTLIRQGLLHFWRFIRITLLTLIAAIFLLGPLALLQSRWARYVDDQFVGRQALLLTLIGLFVFLLAASLFRLYFDLVEAYTVQLGIHLRPNSRQDHRVRRTLGPAFGLLRNHLLRAWSVFIFLAILGAAAAVFSARTAMHMLAQPRVWPMFLVAQTGLFLMLFTRYWQRGAEASLVLQHPILPDAGASNAYDVRPTTPTVPPVPPIPWPASDPPSPDHSHHIGMINDNDLLTPTYPAPLSPDDPIAPLAPAESERPAPDPIPNPEPAAPPLDEPDPGVFHHDPQKPTP